MDPASGQPRPTSTCGLRETQDHRGVVPPGPLPRGPNLPWTGFSAEPEFLPLPFSRQPLSNIPFQNNGMSTEEISAADPLWVTLRRDRREVTPSTTTKAVLNTSPPYGQSHALRTRPARTGFSHIQPRFATLCAEVPPCTSRVFLPASNLPPI